MGLTVFVSTSQATARNGWCRKRVAMIQGARKKRAGTVIFHQKVVMLSQ